MYPGTKPGVFVVLGYVPGYHTPRIYRTLQNALVWRILLITRPVDFFFALSIFVVSIAAERVNMTQVFVRRLRSPKQWLPDAWCPPSPSTDGNNATATGKPIDSSRCVPLLFWTFKGTHRQEAGRGQRGWGESSVSV